MVKPSAAVSAQPSEDASRWHDRVAIVTGAARGIGRATAVALAQQGVRVAINDLADGPDLQQTLAEIRACGSEGLCVPADVANQAALERAVELTVKQFGRLDFAVSNAAYSDREPFHTADMNAFRRTVDVTMWGAFHLVRAATQQMIADGRGGAIVVVSSPHATVPVPLAMAYNMSKAAIDHMARTAAIELVDQRIRVNIVHPGWTDTPGERKFASETELQSGSKLLPWKRLARPEEIARGIVFLCDPASEYVNGSTLLVDGGISLPWWANHGSAVPA